MKIVHKKSWRTSQPDRLHISHRGFDISVDSSAPGIPSADDEGVNFNGLVVNDFGENGSLSYLGVGVLGSPYDVVCEPVLSEGHNAVVFDHSGFSSKYQWSFIKFDTSSNKVLMRDKEDALSLINEFYPDLNLQSFSSLETAYKKTQYVVDKINSHLYVGDLNNKNPLNKVEGLPVIVSEDRKETFHVPLIAVKLYSYLFQSDAVGTSDVNVDNLESIYGTGLKEILGIHTIDDIHPAQRFFRQYDCSKLISGSFPTLDQVVVISVGGTTLLDQGSRFNLVEDLNWEDYQSVASTVFEGGGPPLDGGSRKFYLSGQAGDSSIAKIRIEKSYKLAMDNNPGTEINDTSSYRRINGLLYAAENDGFAHVFAMDQTGTNVDVKVDQRVGAMIPFFSHIFADSMCLILPPIRSILYYEGSSITGEDDYQYYGPNFKGHIFDSPGFTIFPMTYLAHTSGINFTPVRHSHGSLIDSKNVLSATILETEGGIGLRRNIMQPIGGNRIDKWFGSPGSIHFTGFGVCPSERIPDKDEALPCDVCAQLDQLKAALSDIASKQITNSEKLSEILQKIDSLSYSHGSEGGGMDVSLLRQIFNEVLDGRMISLFDKLSQIESAIQNQGTVDCTIPDVHVDLQPILDAIANIQTCSSIPEVGNEHPFSSFPEYELEMDTWLDSLSQFVSSKLATDEVGLHADIVYDVTQDDITRVKGLGEKAIDLRGLASVKMVVTDPEVSVPRFPVTIGSKKISIGRQPIDMSKEFLKTSALCLNSGAIGTQLLNGSLYSARFRKQLAGLENQLSAWKANSVRVVPIIIPKEELPLRILGYITLQSAGAFSLTKEKISGDKISLPVLCQFDEKLGSAFVLVNPSYPDAWITGCMSLMLSVGVSSYLDKSCFYNVIPPLNLEQLSKYTKQDVYRRRASISLCELSSCLMIEVIKYERTMISGHIDDIARTGFYERSNKLIDMHILHDDSTFREEIRSMYDDGLVLDRLNKTVRGNAFCFSDNHCFWNLVDDVENDELCNCDLVSSHIILV